MGTVFIDIAAMTDFVAALKSTISTSRLAAADLLAKCEVAGEWDQDCASFNDGESTRELEAILIDAQRRLDLAILVATGTMSFGGFAGDLPPVVLTTEQIDCFEKGQEWAAKVDAGTMTTADWAAFNDAVTGPGGRWTAAGLFGSVSLEALVSELATQVKVSNSVPGWLVTAVIACQGDPGCEDMVARALPVDLLELFLNQIQSAQDRLVASDDPSLKDFLTLENLLLYGLGRCLSGSASRMGGDELEDYTASWVSAVQSSVPGMVNVEILRLVVGRGHWPLPFLTEFHQAVGQWVGLPSDKTLSNVRPDILTTDPFDPSLNRQRGIGDCWLVSTINALMETEEGRQLLRDNVRWDPSAGGYQVTVYDDSGDPVTVLVTQIIDQGATVNGQPGIVALYEAAVMLNGGWGGLEGRLPWLGPTRIAGQDSNTYVHIIASISDNAVESGGSANGGISLASTRPRFPFGNPPQVAVTHDPNLPGLPDTVTILFNHVYEVVDIQNGMIGLRNPWGPKNSHDGGGVFYVTQQDFDNLFFGQTQTD